MLVGLDELVLKPPRKLDCWNIHSPPENISGPNNAGDAKKGAQNEPDSICVAFNARYVPSQLLPVIANHFVHWTVHEVQGV